MHPTAAAGPLGAGDSWGPLGAFQQEGAGGPPAHELLPDAPPSGCTARDAVGATLAGGPGGVAAAGGLLAGATVAGASASAAPGVPCPSGSDDCMVADQGPRPAAVAGAKQQQQQQQQQDQQQQQQDQQQQHGAEALPAGKHKYGQLQLQVQDHQQQQQQQDQQPVSRDPISPLTPEGSCDAAASAARGSSDEEAGPDGGAGSLCSLPRPNSASSDVTALALGGASASPPALLEHPGPAAVFAFGAGAGFGGVPPGLMAAVEAQFKQEQQEQQHHHHHQQQQRHGLHAIPPGVVGTFFPVERPRPPPAGDQVNFAQRIMEICFSAATQWPLGLDLQFVVDGAPRGAPVGVTVGRSVCKSQVSGSRQVIYYVRNPALLRLARSFDARTIGYRLAGPSTLEWHLSTAPAPPAAAALPKGPGRRKVAKAHAGGGHGGGARGGALQPESSDDWGQSFGGAAAAAAQAQYMMMLHQLAAPGAAAAGAGALPPLPPQAGLDARARGPFVGAGLAAWIAAGGEQPADFGWGAASAADAAGALAAAAGSGQGCSLSHRAKRRKQQHPSRAPFYGLQSGSPGAWQACCAATEAAREAHRKQRAALAGSRRASEAAGAWAAAC